ncbi:hypothetical protein RUND412_007979 [Rhizina undulata]
MESLPHSGERAWPVPDRASCFQSFSAQKDASYFHEGVFIPAWDQSTPQWFNEMSHVDEYDGMHSKENDANGNILHENVTHSDPAAAEHTVRIKQSMNGLSKK